MKHSNIVKHKIAFIVACKQTVTATIMLSGPNI